jgi:hypothetical protein
MRLKVFGGSFISSARILLARSRALVVKWIKGGPPDAMSCSPSLGGADR